jgi:ABC-type taurine transport system substrate-binding protein
MFKALVSCSLCTALWLPAAHAETFVIEADRAGHEATIRIPAGAVTQLSAKSAEWLDGYAGSQVEAMRLSGDVLIGIAGSAQPIQIKADRLVLELTADSIPSRISRGRADAAINQLVRSTSHAGAEDSQVFVGNVVFDLQSSSGPVEIKADKVEHQLRSEPGM